jgi:ABC-type transporter Mla MlaB component
MSRTRKSAAPADLRLPPQLLIDSIADLKHQLEPLLDKPGKVVLDAADVERTHTAALQLFCLFCRDRNANGREVEFARPSAALRSAASLLGTASLLHLTQEGT